MGNQANPQRALQGRYSCRAQGASPGLIVEIHLLSPARAALPHGKCSRRKCRSYGALNFCVRVYPGFHFGLCPHFTLGFAGVSCLKALTPASPNKSNNKRKQRQRPTNPTINTNNDTPNKSDNKHKQRHHPTNPTTNTNNQQPNNDTEQ